MIARQIIGYTVGPFDEGDTVHTKEFVETEIREFLGATEAVRIAVTDRKRRRVFVDQCERRAMDDFIRNAKGFRHGLNESCFSGPEITHQCDYITGSKRCRERSSGGFSVGFGLPDNFPHGGYFFRKPFWHWKIRRAGSDSDGLYP